jgi:hypothetical protein
MFRNILNSKFNSFKKNSTKTSTTAILASTIGYYFYSLQQKNYKNNVLACDDSESAFDRDNLSNLESGLNSQLEFDRLQELKDSEKNVDKTREIPDLPFEMMEDDNMENLQELMENPDMDPETYQMIMAQSQNTQPPPFKSLNQGVKSHSDGDQWTGLKLNAEYSPIQNAKFEYEFNHELVTPNPKHGSKYSIMSMNALESDPSKSLVVVGRFDPAFVHSCQLHGALSQTDKISCVANFKKDDPNQAIWEAEYTKSFERMIISGKLCNMGNGISATVNAWKNTHLGLELGMNPKTGEIMYSYGISSKPLKQLGVAFMYLSGHQMLSLDALFMVNLFIVYIYFFQNSQIFFSITETIKHILLSLTVGIQ